MVPILLWTLLFIITYMRIQSFGDSDNSIMKYRDNFSPNNHPFTRILSWTSIQISKYQLWTQHCENQVSDTFVAFGQEFESFYLWFKTHSSIIWIFIAPTLIDFWGALFHSSCLTLTSWYQSAFDQLLIDPSILSAQVTRSWRNLNREATFVQYTIGYLKIHYNEG